MQLGHAQGAAKLMVQKALGTLAARENPIRLWTAMIYEKTTPINVQPVHFPARVWGEVFTVNSCVHRLVCSFSVSPICAVLRT